MKNTKKTILLTVLSSIILAIVNPSLAQTKIEFDYENTAFENKELTMGAVKVLVDYKPVNFDRGYSLENKNL